MVKRHVAFTPTLVAARGSWLRFEQDSTLRNAAAVPTSIRAWWAAVYPPQPDAPAAHVQGRRIAFERSLEIVHDMHAAGVTILAGTDVGAFGVLPGSSLPDAAGGTRAAARATPSGTVAAPARTPPPSTR